MLQSLALHSDTAALKSLQPIDTAQQGAFARAAFANDGDHLAGGDIQVNPLQHFIRTKRFAQRGYLNHRIGHGANIFISKRLAYQLMG